jgi:hypothetical protein
MGLKISDLTPIAANSLDGTEPVELGIAGDKNAPNGAFLPPGYIDGLKMQWDAVDGITVTSGAAYIQSLGRVVRAGANISKAGLSLTASTWYHVYLYLNAGAADVEIVTTAPDAPYNGTARSKTGDTSRRYLGSILTDSAGNIYNFLQSGLSITYRIPFDSTPFRVINNGLATVFTDVDFGAVIPLTSFLTNARFTNTDTANAVRITTSDSSGDPAAGNFGVSPASLAFGFFNVDPSQKMQYKYTSTPTGGGFFADVLGYIYER